MTGLRRLARRYRITTCYLLCSGVAVAATAAVDHLQLIGAS